MYTFYTCTSLYLSSIYPSFSLSLSLSISIYIYTCICVVQLLHILATCVGAFIILHHGMDLRRRPPCVLTCAAAITEQWAARSLHTYSQYSPTLRGLGNEAQFV